MERHPSVSYTPGVIYWRPSCRSGPSHIDRSSDDSILWGGFSVLRRTGTRRSDSGRDGTAGREGRPSSHRDVPTHGVPRFLISQTHTPESHPVSHRDICTDPDSRCVSVLPGVGETSLARLKEEKKFRTRVPVSVRTTAVVVVASDGSGRIRESWVYR